MAARPILASAVALVTLRSKRFHAIGVRCLAHGCQTMAGVRRLGYTRVRQGAPALDTKTTLLALNCLRLSVDRCPSAPAGVGVRALENETSRRRFSSARPLVLEGKGRRAVPTKYIAAARKQHQLLVWCAAMVA